MAFAFAIAASERVVTSNAIEKQKGFFITLYSHTIGASFANVAFVRDPAAGSAT